MRALGETRDVFVIQKYLDMTLNQVEHEKQICKGSKNLTFHQTEVRSQDVQTVLAAVASNPAGHTN